MSAPRYAPAVQLALLAIALSLCALVLFDWLPVRALSVALAIVVTERVTAIATGTDTEEF